MFNMFFRLLDNDNDYMVNCLGRTLNKMAVREEGNINEMGHIFNYHKIHFFIMHIVVLVIL